MGEEFLFREKIFSKHKLFSPKICREEYFSRKFENNFLFEFLERKISLTFREKKKCFELSRKIFSSHFQLTLQDIDPFKGRFQILARGFDMNIFFSIFQSMHFYAPKIRVLQKLSFFVMLSPFVQPPHSWALNFCCSKNSY